MRLSTCNWESMRFLTVVPAGTTCVLIARRVSQKRTAKFGPEYSLFLKEFTVSVNTRLNRNVGPVFVDMAEYPGFHSVRGVTIARSRSLNKSRSSFTNVNRATNRCSLGSQAHCNEKNRPSKKLHRQKRSEKGNNLECDGVLKSFHRQC